MTLFRRRKKTAPPTREPVKRSRTKEEAARSLARERSKYERIKAETPFYAALGKSLKELHEHNHIVENLTNIIGGRP